MEDKWTGSEPATKLFPTEKETALPFLQRFNAVQKTIVTECEAGTLIAAYRAEATGNMCVIPRQWWNTDQWGPRFHMCQINPNKPISIGFAGDDYCWIFLSQDSLERLLRRLSSELNSRHDPACREPDKFVERWPIPEKEPPGPKRAAAWRLAKRVWGDDGGPSKGRSWRELTDELNKQRIDGETLVGEDTVKRIFLPK
jgi:hypothetical protein